MGLKPLRAAFAAIIVLSGAGTASAATDGWADAAGTSLHYRDEGSGARTIILLHEIGTGLEAWDEVAPRLARHARVVRYDLRGFGLSQKIRGKISLADEEADLAGLIDALAIKTPIDLVGAAIGGSIAVRYAADHPDRVRRLVVVSPIFAARPPGAPSPAPMAMPAPAKSAADVLEQDGLRAYLTPQQLAATYPPSAQASRPDRFARFMGLQLANDPMSRAATLRAANGEDFAPLLPKLSMPVLLIATTQFALGPLARIEALGRQIPGARVEAIDAGHIATIAAPEALAAEIAAFLENDAPGAQGERK